MTGKRRLFRRPGRRQTLLLAACITGYLMWPYVALYRMGGALRRGDVQTLTADVEWDAVREGLKEDIADQVVAPTTDAVPNVVDKLPPFGSGFLTALADKVVDRTVTPEHLAQSQSEIQAASKESRESLRSAWFSSPTEFEARFQLPSDDSGPIPVRVRMDLMQVGWGMKWRITRVWIPMAVLQHPPGNAT
jgi:hypothetical protein